MSATKTWAEMTAKEQDADLLTQARTFLERNCPPGTTVYTDVKHVSKSGMSRDIAVYIILDGEICDISGYVARILGYRRRDNGGVRVGGCGMDMGYHLVMNLSYALHGWKNVNVPEEKNGRPFTPSVEAYRAGYSLNHRWI